MLLKKGRPLVYRLLLWRALLAVVLMGLSCQWTLLQVTMKKHANCIRTVDSSAVVVGVSFVSRFRLRPLMGTCQEQPGMYLS